MQRCLEKVFCRVCAGHHYSTRRRAKHKNPSGRGRRGGKPSNAMETGLGMDGEYRAGGAFYDLVGHTAEDGALQSIPAMCAHDDHIDFFFVDKR
jgi:hypothetical protein